MSQTVESMARFHHQILFFLGGSQNCEASYRGILDVLKYSACKVLMTNS